MNLRYFLRLLHIFFSSLECIALCNLFDQFEILLAQEEDEEKSAELKYDFDLARDSIIEMFRHRMRTVQQDACKSHVMSSMNKTTAFETIDWAQKILPQIFREGQTAYFGKKGMSALVGSFTFYDLSGKISLFNQLRVFFNEFVETLTTRTYILCLTRCDQTEQATLSGGYLILKQFKSDFPHVTSVVKRSDNASVLAGQATPEAECLLARKAGVELLMRDYSEVQAGKDVCDRIVGAAKMRMRAYLNAGNDVTNASQIKSGSFLPSITDCTCRSQFDLGMEYCGGIKHVFVGTAVMIEKVPSITKCRIPDISMIRNIVYKENQMITRKASEIGQGRRINFTDIDVPINMKIIESFGPWVNQNNTWNMQEECHLTSLASL